MAPWGTPAQFEKLGAKGRGLKRKERRKKKWERSKRKFLLTWLTTRGQHNSR